MSEDRRDFGNDSLGPENPSGSRSIPASQHDIREITRVIRGEEWTKTMLEAAEVIRAAADKAKANGLPTKKDLDKSVSANTWYGFMGQITVVAVAVYFLVRLMVDPMQRQQDRADIVASKLAEALVNIQLDLRDLYKVSPTQRSDRLEKPPERIEALK